VNIIKENLFFVVMGVVVLLALVLFVVLVQPLKSSNSELGTRVDGLVKSLGELQKPSTPTNPVLPNARAMEAAGEYNRAYVEQLEKVKLTLSKMSLSSTLKGLDEATRNEPGAYKDVYAREVEGLKRRLGNKKIETGPNSWHFWDWGTGVPSDAGQRVQAAKELDLTSLLAEVVCKPSLDVRQLVQVEVNPDEARSGEFRAGSGPGTSGSAAKKRREPYFDVLPFVLEVRMPIDRCELLLRELYEKNLAVPIYVSQVSIGRIEDEPRFTRRIPPLIVTIRIEGSALDYRVEEAPKKAAARSTR
jgi:hypothetical protein